MALTLLTEELSGAQRGFMEQYTMVLLVTVYLGKK
jgi:hypothetical protein